jgi:endonuclease G
MLRKPNLDRPDRFNPDYDVDSRSAYHSDYSGSGYTRGHLVPAADMSWDEEAQKETFLMSNIAPQPREFNGGIWKELEESVRDWTYHNDRLYITSGPLFLENLGNIGKKNRVAIPSHFYKTLMDIDGKQQKAIAFIIPNKKSVEKLSYYATTVDDVENKTGFDFYPNILTQDKEEELESSFDINDWNFSEKRYELRINKWNNQ